MHDQLVFEEPLDEERPPYSVIQKQLIILGKHGLAHNE